eukprot:g17238.t1
MKGYSPRLSPVSSRVSTVFPRPPEEDPADSYPYDKMHLREDENPLEAAHVEIELHSKDGEGFGDAFAQLSPQMQAALKNRCFGELQRVMRSGEISTSLALSEALKEFLGARTAYRAPRLTVETGYLKQIQESS